MGVEPYLVASSLEAVLAQRLVRVLCPHCAEPDTSAHAESFRRKMGVGADAPLRRAVGCRKCRGSGFFGRHALFEWMDVDEVLRTLILERASTDQIRNAARAAGMKTLAEDGRCLVARGLTTVEEILSVTIDKEASPQATSPTTATEEEGALIQALGMPTI